MTAPQQRERARDRWKARHEVFDDMNVGESAMVNTPKGPRVIHKLSSCSYIMSRPDLQREIARMILDGAPARDSFTSPQRRTKRQKRRQRGNP